MNFSLSATISLVVLAFYIVLLLVVVLRDFRSRVNRYFSLYLLTMIVWSFGSLMIFSEAGSQGTLFWNRWMTTGQMAMPVAFFAFVDSFLQRRGDPWLKVGLISYLLVLLFTFSGNVIVDAYVIGNEFHNRYAQSGLILTSLVWVLFIGLSTGLLIAEYRKTRDSLFRNRIRYILLVIIVVFLGSLTNATQLRIYPVDVALNIVSALLTAYAILRHQLLDITLVVRKGLGYSIPTVLIGASYFLVISLVLKSFPTATGLEYFLLSMLAAILVALVAEPIRDRAQAWVDQHFFREKYDSGLMLQRVSQAAVSTLDLQRLTEMILEEVTRTLHIQRAAIFLKQEPIADFHCVASRGLNGKSPPALSYDHPLVRLLEERQSLITGSEVRIYPQFTGLWSVERQQLEDLQAEIYIPLLVKDQLIGLFTIGGRASNVTYSGDDRRMLATLTNQTAVAIENARLYALARAEIAERRMAEEKLQYQLMRIRGLHTIDTAISSSLDIHVILEIILKQVVELMQVDTAAVLVLNRETMKLEYAAGRGFQTRALQYTSLRLGEGLAGRAAMERAIIHIPDLGDEVTSLEASPLLSEEGFVSYFGVPLIVKGEVKGVMEVFHRTALDATQDRLEHLKTLSTETAIAVESAELFSDLQKSNSELVRAYSSTLEGWSRALELRDMETEGHSQRVTRMTVNMALKLGISNELELTHLRHGALLHDIGKMAIPDSILLKPGPLTEEEWVIMRQHPVYANELLSNIAFLRPALDIPYCHHEKWDGSGYPQGLAGTQIPLASRIFAVADVWDALRSDRPYRQAWDKQSALEYIQQEAGGHFDPEVVRVFCEIAEELETV